MFISRFNDFTKKYYKYKKNEINVNYEYDPMFDDSLHNNNIILNIDNNYNYNKTCAYCNKCFISRNRLFHHLAFMNINIINNYQIDIDNDDIDFISEMKIKKKNKKKKMMKIWLRKQKIKKIKMLHTKYQINAITNLFENKFNL